MTTENAYVQADMVGVANDISGIVSKIEVKENQPVAVGDVLFRLDDKPFRLEEKLDGPLFSVTVAHSKLIKPAELRAVDGVFRLH